MSTRVTEEVLKWVQRDAHHTSIVAVRTRLAVAELAAIRHAARVLSNASAYSSEEWKKASDLIKALAEDGS